MFAIKKFATLLALLALSCGKHDFDESVSSSVTFFNESSYSVSIYMSYFSGSLLVDKLSSGNSFKTKINPSDNYGLGSIFSIEYWYLVANGAELSCGDVWIGGIDPDMQIMQNLESGKSYTIQIPNPSKLELQETFVKIINASDSPIEFMRTKNLSYRQASCGEISIPSGKIGVYRFDSKTGNIDIKEHIIRQGLDNFYDFPELSAESGKVYSFEFHNDKTIVQKGEPQTLIF